MPGSNSASSMVDEAFLLAQRNAQRALVAKQGDKLCASCEQLLKATCEEELTIFLSDLREEVARFRAVQNTPVMLGGGRG